jgi:hypothetical protein
VAANPSPTALLRVFRKLTSRAFWRSVIVAALFGLTNVAAHCVTVYYTAELNAKTVATALAFGVVSFSLTMCVLEAIASDIEELGIVDPPAVLTIMMLYIFGLCSIFLAAHAEIVYVIAKDKTLAIFTVLSSLGLFFAILFQALIERKLLRVFERAKARYPEQYRHKQLTAVALQALVVISLVISAMKLFAKLKNEYAWAAQYLVMVDVAVVLYAVGLGGAHCNKPSPRNNFEAQLRS